MSQIQPRTINIAPEPQPATVHPVAVRILIDVQALAVDAADPAWQVDADELARLVAQAVTNGLTPSAISRGDVVVADVTAGAYIPIEATGMPEVSDIYVGAEHRREDLVQPSAEPVLVSEDALPDPSGLI